MSKPNFALRIERYFFSGNTEHVLESDLYDLDEYILCQRLNCLPQSGGLYDQDWDIIKKFGIITQALEKKEKFDEEDAERKKRLKDLGGQ